MPQDGLSGILHLRPIEPEKRASRRHRALLRRCAALFSVRAEPSLGSISLLIAVSWGSALACDKGARPSG
jgi:hypothetical protein